MTDKSKSNTPSGGFRAFYSRPPLFMVVTAPSADALAAKIAELDAKHSQSDRSG
jgi:hypothetical protein